MFPSLQGFVFRISKTSTPKQLTVVVPLKCPTEQSIWIAKYLIKQLYSHWYCPLPQNSNLIWGMLKGIKIQRIFQCKYVEDWFINHKQFCLLYFYASWASPQLTESGTLASVSAWFMSTWSVRCLMIRYAKGKKVNSKPGKISKASAKNRWDCRPWACNPLSSSQDFATDGHLL